MVYEGIRESMKYSNEHLDEVSLNAARWEQFSPGQLKEYFRTLKFGFDEKQKEGLREFYRYAHRYGFLGKEPELRFI
jgi:predicted solute-binding protein